MTQIVERCNANFRGEIVPSCFSLFVWCHHFQNMKNKLLAVTVCPQGSRLPTSAVPELPWRRAYLNAKCDVKKRKCRLKNVPTPQRLRRQKKAPGLRCRGPCSSPPNSADALPSDILVYPQRTECRCTRALSPCEVCVSTPLALTFTFPQHPCIFLSNSPLLLLGSFSPSISPFHSFSYFPQQP